MNFDKLAFVDIETTGSRINHDRIIEIGILRVENNQLVRTYQQLINPETYISPFIEQITHISTKDVVNAPTFEDIKEELLEVLDGCVFVAHNVRFDYGFLKNEFRRYGHQFAPKHFCTVKLSKALFPQYTHHNLDALMQRFNITCENRHRAFGDAKVLWDFYQMLHNDLPAEQLLTALESVMYKPIVPQHLNVEVLNTLPEQPGVYIFYGENDIPLYVGKSINIKDRVLSHFSNDYTSSKEMNIVQQTHRIETIPTVGELGALLKEAALIKQLQPLYNRRLRKKNSITVAKRIETKDGYFSIALEELSDISPHDTEHILGIYKSKKHAKEQLAFLADEHVLCEKILGLDRATDSCFNYKLQRCYGACIGEEKTIRYNMRFQMAFNKTKIKTWPFEGPIFIEEKNELEQRSEVFTVNKWCLVGNATFEESMEYIPLDNDFNFDLDTYKILAKYILNPQNNKHIKSMPSNYGTHTDAF